MNSALCRAEVSSVHRLYWREPRQPLARGQIVEVAGRPRRSRRRASAGAAPRARAVRRSRTSRRGPRSTIAWPRQCLDRGLDLYRNGSCDRDVGLSCAPIVRPSGGIGMRARQTRRAADWSVMSISLASTSISRGTLDDDPFGACAVSGASHAGSRDPSVAPPRVESRSPLRSSDATFEILINV